MQTVLVPPASMESFTWASLWSELKQRAPLSATVMESFLPSFKEKNDNVTPVLCMCFAIILKKRNPKMNMVQSFISLTLYAVLEMLAHRYFHLANYLRPCFLINFYLLAGFKETTKADAVFVTLCNTKTGRWFRVKF